MGKVWLIIMCRWLRYFPVVGVVMFWPYVLMPVMEYLQ